MATFDVLGGLSILFGILNVIAPGFGFRSRWLTSKDSTVTEAGAGLTRATGGILIVIGILLLLV